MNIAIVLRRYPPCGGGAENQCARISSALSAEGHAVTVLTGGIRIHERASIPPAVGGSPRIARIWSPPIWLFGSIVFLSMLLLRMLFLRPRPDIVMTYFINETTFVSVLAAKLLGIPSCVYPSSLGRNGNLAAAKRHWCGRLYLWSFRHCNAIICQSQSLYPELLAYGIDARKLATIANSVAPQFFKIGQTRQVSKSSLGRPTRILWCGRLSQEKNPLILFELTSILREKRLSFILEIAGGGGPLVNQMQRQLHANPELAANIDFQPNPVDILPSFSGADLLILTSISEMMPLVIIEAMAARVPVIATSVGAIPEMVAHRETGILVPSGDPMAMASAVEELIFSPELRERMAINAARYVAAHHSPDDIARQYVEVFARLVR